MRATAAAPRNHRSPLAVARAGFGAMTAVAWSYPTICVAAGHKPGPRRHLTPQ
jgi:hypothetical protein